MSSILRIEGTNAWVTDADGVEHALSTVIAEACADIGATMDEYRAESNGLSVGFNARYFPKGNELDAAGRSDLNFRKAAAHVAIYQKLVELGVPAENLRFSEGYRGRDGQWRSSKKVYLNATQARAGASSTMSEKDRLEAEYMEHDGDIDKLLNIQSKLEGRDAMYVGWLRKEVKALRVTEATGRLATQVENENVHEQVPSASGAVDTSNF